MGRGESWPRTEPLPELMRRNRSAVAVHAALKWLAKGRRQLGTTRARIADVTNLGKSTISGAMQALDAARWIKLRYGRRGVKAWYRVTLAPDVALWPEKQPTGAPKPAAPRPPVARKTAHRETGVGSKNGPQGMSRCDTFFGPMVCYTHTIDGGKTTPTPPVGGGSGVASPPPPIPDADTTNPAAAAGDAVTNGLHGGKGKTPAEIAAEVFGWDREKGAS